MFRKIEMKTATITTDDGEDIQFCYRDTILGFLRSPLDHAGLSVADIKQLVPVIDAIARSGDSVVLSDDEWKLVCARMETGLRFRIADRVVLDFIDDIEAAEAVEEITEP